MAGTVKSILLASTIVGAGLAAVENAQAQTASLSEVVVTAQRRTQRLEEVPISITALSGAQLDKAGVQNLRDLQTVAPSFQVSSSGVFTQLSIRGITSTALGPGIENNIAVYVDGFYEPDSSGLGSDFANVTSVQILKGPQGTLYGRNATGGALLVDTREPNDSRPIVDLTFGYGNLNDRRARAYVGVPLSHGLSFGIGAYYRANDGYITNIVDGSHASPYEDSEVRAKLKWEPNSKLSFVLGQNYFRKSDPIALAYTVVGASFLNPPLGAITPGPVFSNRLDYVSLRPNPVFTVRMNETTLRAKWVTDYGTFTSHTSYTFEKPHFDNDYDGTALFGLEIPATFLRNTVLEQFDYDVKPISTLVIQAGAFYFDDTSSDDATLISGPLFGLPAPTITQEAVTTMWTKAYAGYVDATWEMVPHLFLNAGVRYSHDKRTVFAYYKQLLGHNPPPPFAPATTASFPATTPRATLRWEFSPRSNVYFSYSQGFKSGTFNTVSVTAAGLTTPVEPEKVKAYEVGFKTAQGPFHVEAAAYYYDYKNLQVNSLTSNNNAIVVILTNAASAKIYGVEASGEWAVTRDFNLRAGFAWTHARYGSFPAASVTLPYPPNGPVVTVNTVPLGGYPGLNEPPGAPLTENFSGKRIARAPDWTANISGDYTFHIGDDKLVLAASGYYTSEYAQLAVDYNPLTGKPFYYNDGYFTANASLDYIHGPYTAEIWVNDIGDTRYFVLNQADTFGIKQTLSSPRTFGIRVSYAY
jgi:iron complex outermembrane receptor protein